MPSLVLRFPARRYHATPWGHHVNEGLVEWPPSPWRLLRALVSVGYTKLGWALVPPVGRSLFERLASVLPRYRVPTASTAHSRHYMPIGGLRKDGLENTTMVLDTWARVDEGELVATWDVTLEPAERDLLCELASRLGYIGRAESWVDARLAEDGDAHGEAATAGWESMPCDWCARPGPGWEQVALLAPETPEAYRAWRDERMQAAVSSEPLKKRGGRGGQSDRGTRGRKGTEPEPFPQDIVACLESDTRWLQEQGWTQPPGSRRVLYWRRADALEVAAPRAASVTRGASPVEAMLLALATDSGNEHALPGVARTLPQAERFHRALVRHLCKRGEPCESIVGLSADGAPLRGHRHAHVLPLDLDGDGHLDHVLVWAPMLLSGVAQEAVRGVRRTYMKGGVGELRVALAGVGAAADLGRFASAVVGPAAGSAEWISATPFVAPRHVKARGKDTIDGQVQAELASRGLPRALEVEVIDPSTAPGSLRERIRAFRHFILERADGPRAPYRIGLALRIRFDEPIRGPLCLGYASHFGLGRFDAVK